MPHLWRNLTALQVAVLAFVNFSFLFANNTDSKVSTTPAEPYHLNLPKNPFDYEGVMVPEYAKQFDLQGTTHEITNRGATLGRVLFYDKRLSVNGSVSCGTCHRQEFAFSDSRSKSIGFNGREGIRNSMSLVNLRFNPTGKFFWDQRATSLEQQVLMPIEDPNEMGHSITGVRKTLSRDPTYLRLFSEAYGDQSISAERIANALTQFLRSMVSFHSKYDVGISMARDVRLPFPNFTDQENLGKTQFFGRGRCAECHLPQLHGNHGDQPQFAVFQLHEPVVNGIDIDEPGRDQGVGMVTGEKRDIGSFRVSSLRNIELTAPYMHDGRFQTLDQVIEHYNWSVKPHPNLDSRLEDFSANGMALPEVEKVALAAFLKTLTDHEFIKDPKFSDPFVRNENVIAGSAPND